MGLLFSERERIIMRQTAKSYFHQIEGTINLSEAILWIGKASKLGINDDVHRFLTPFINAENAKRTKTHDTYESHWN